LNKIIEIDWNQDKYCHLFYSDIGSSLFIYKNSSTAIILILAPQGAGVEVESTSKLF
jgi:hypothetical protein